VFRRYRDKFTFTFTRVMSGTTVCSRLNGLLSSLIKLPITNINKNTGAVLVISNETTSTHMFISSDQNVGYKHKIKMAHRQLESVAKFGCFRILTDKNCMHREIKKRLNCGSC